LIILLIVWRLLVPYLLLYPRYELMNMRVMWLVLGSSTLFSKKTVVLTDVTDSCERNRIRKNKLTNLNGHERTSWNSCSSDPSGFAHQRKKTNSTKSQHVHSNGHEKNELSELGGSWTCRNDSWRCWGGESFRMFYT